MLIHWQACSWYIRVMDKSADPTLDSPPWLTHDVTPAKPIDDPLPTLPPIPSWMLPATPVAELKLHNELRMFENCLDGLLAHVAAGNPLSAAVERDPRGIDYVRLLAWINRDEGRKARYREAQELGAEVVADQMLAIADAADTIEDVQRSTLRINTRKWLLGVWNRKRYGEVRQVDQNITIDMTQALVDAQARVDRARTVDVTEVRVR